LKSLAAEKISLAPHELAEATWVVKRIDEA